MTLNGDMTLSVMLDGDLTHSTMLSGELGEFLKVQEGEIYHGDTEITPDDSAQVLYTKGKVLEQDIVVSAIPYNYGLIEWNGSVLTVM